MINNIKNIKQNVQWTARQTGTLNAHQTSTANDENPCGHTAT